MVSILLSGCNGKMGKVISQAVSARNDCKIIAGIDIHAAASDSDFPVFQEASLCDISPDVVVDFSHPSVTIPLLDWACQKKIPTVIATTGLGKEQLAAIHQASSIIPVFFSANMSLGVTLLAELAKKAAHVLGYDFDVEIIEKHHNQKLDAPSGTALLLAEAVSSELPQEPQYVYDRHSKRAKRGNHEIGIHSIRGGTIVGEHEILFAGHDELITLTHTAISKEIFGTGAINAALFLPEREAGLYNMADLV